MIKKDRFLIGILLGITVLIGVTTILVFGRLGKEVYLSEDQPENVVHNYTLALINHDYRKAYGYLAEEEYKPSFEQFTELLQVDYGLILDETAVSIGETKIMAERAFVTIHLLQKGYSTFNGISFHQAVLVRQGEEWKLIDGGSYNLWSYQWYQEPYEEGNDW